MKLRKVFSKLLVLVLLMSVLLSACQGIAGTAAIQSWLDEPLDGAEISTGESITLRAHARDANGQGIVEVKFLVNGELVSTVKTNSSLPLVQATTKWQPDAPGSYTVEAVAVGGSGTRSSPGATVSVVGGEEEAAGGEEVADANSPPEIVNVSGPPSIPADGQEYEFIVSFADNDGDINMLSVSSRDGKWDDISFDPSRYLYSGNVYSGTTRFAYMCSVGSASFTDTLSIVLDDASGSSSKAYTFKLSCEGQAEPEPPKTYAPVITFVDGPASIPADSKRHYFNLGFTDTDGDVDRLIVTSDKGKWGRIDIGSPLPLDSGDRYNGTVSFSEFCTGYIYFSDTLRIKLYDAAGNVSNTYAFDLQCEGQSEVAEVPSLDMPPERFASHASLSFPGGHGSVHSIGEAAQLCYTFTGVGASGPEGTGYSFYLYDFQPASPGSNGVDTSGPNQLIASGFAADGTKCFTDGEVTGPGGYEAFRLELYQGYYNTLLEFAELWIYVQP